MRKIKDDLPSQYGDKSQFNDKKRGFSMTTGKAWTLKDSKADETTPGPVYQTQFLQSIH